MKKELARAMLAVAVLIPPTNVASQSAQHDSIQANATQIAPSTSDRKPQKVYHIGGDVKAPRVISSFQPSLSEEQIRQLRSGKKVAKRGSTILRIVVGEDGTVRSASEEGCSGGCRIRGSGRFPFVQIGCSPFLCLTSPRRLRFFADGRRS